MMHLMLPAPPCKQTYACENITFPQIYLREVEMKTLNELLKEAQRLNSINLDAIHQEQGQVSYKF